MERDTPQEVCPKETLCQRESSSRQSSDGSGYAVNSNQEMTWSGVRSVASDDMGVKIKDHFNFDKIF